MRWRNHFWEYVRLFTLAPRTNNVRLNNTLRLPTRRCAALQGSLHDTVRFPDAHHGFTHLNCRSARTSRQHTRSARQDAHLHLWVRQVFSQHGPLEKAGGRGCEGLSAAARDLVPHGEYGPGGVWSTRSQDAPRTYKEPPPRQLRTRLLPSLVLLRYACTTAAHSFR